MSELKPCPFCGGKAEARYVDEQWMLWTEHDMDCPL